LIDCRKGLAGPDSPDLDDASYPLFYDDPGSSPRDQPQLQFGRDSGPPTSLHAARGYPSARLMNLVAGFDPSGSPPPLSNHHGGREALHSSSPPLLPPPPPPPSASLSITEGHSYFSVRVRRLKFISFLEFFLLLLTSSTVIMILAIPRVAFVLYSAKDFIIKL
jgi:hypothetical protein